MISYLFVVVGLQVLIFTPVSLVLLETGKSLNLRAMAKKMDMAKDKQCAVGRAVVRGLLKSPVLQSGSFGSFITWRRFGIVKVSQFD